MRFTKHKRIIYFSFLKFIFRDRVGAVYMIRLTPTRKFVDSSNDIHPPVLDDHEQFQHHHQ